MAACAGAAGRGIAELQAVKEAGPCVAVLLAETRAPQEVLGDADDRGDLIGDLGHEEGGASGAGFALLATDKLANEDVFPALRGDAVGDGGRTGGVGGQRVCAEDLAEGENRFVSERARGGTHGEEGDLAVFRLRVHGAGHGIRVAVGWRCEHDVAG